jgi:hypothetical protein
MIGEKELQRYRRMSLDDRLREFDLLMDVSFEFLASLPPGERRRRWEVWSKEDEESAGTMAEKLARLPR